MKSDVVRNTQTRKPLIFVAIIILTISSFFMPLILVYLLQDSLYHSRDYWFFGTPLSAYFTFFAGMFWIPIVLSIHLIVALKFEPKFLNWLTTGLLLLSIPCFMFAVSNYYFFDEKGLHYNELSTFKKVTTYEWDQFKEVQEVYRNDDRPTTLTEYKFITPENKVIQIPFNVDFRMNQKRILKNLKENGVKVTEDNSQINK